MPGVDLVTPLKHSTPLRLHGVHNGVRFVRFAAGADYSSISFSVAEIDNIQVFCRTEVFRQPQANQYFLVRISSQQLLAREEGQIDHLCFSKGHQHKRGGRP